MLALMFTAILGLSVQDVKPIADVVLVVERAPRGGLIYRCNGVVLDSKRVASGIQGALRQSDAAATKMFVLFEDRLSLDESFEVASLVEGVVGLTNVRYFAYSNKTRVMLEMKIVWDRWKVSFDGKLEKNPR